MSLSPARLRQAMRVDVPNAKWSGRESSVWPGCPKLLDTSTIIDGRIVDICRSGFIEGKIIILTSFWTSAAHCRFSRQSQRNKGRRAWIP